MRNGGNFAVNDFGLTDILRAVVSGGEAALPSDTYGWEELYDMAAAHSLLPVVFAEAADKPRFLELDGAHRARWRADSLAVISEQTRRTAEYSLIIPRLEASGIPYVHVKGLICRSLYPIPDSRYSGDEDILVSAEHAEECRRIFEDCGVVAVGRTASWVLTGVDRRSGLRIELHAGELFAGGILAEYNRYFVSMLDRRKQYSACGITLSTLPETVHLLYLLLHAYKHFLGPGFGLRQITDISLFAKTFDGVIDWDGLLIPVAGTPAERFCRAVITVCVKKTGLTGGAESLADERICAELYSDILDSGVFGRSSLSRAHSAGMTVSASLSTGSPLLCTLFPPLSAMRKRYAFVDKCPFLLPVGWIYRMLCYAVEIHADRRRGTDNSAGKSLKLGRARVKMMRKYGFIDRK